jgi:hypothetical protein
MACEHLQIGGLNLEFFIKEITEQEEFAAYQALAQFHYRSNRPYGHTAPLIVRKFHPIYPKVIGYIELATPFFMNKARNAILNAPFKIFLQQRVLKMAPKNGNRLSFLSLEKLE